MNVAYSSAVVSPAIKSMEARLPCSSIANVRMGVVPSYESFVLVKALWHDVAPMSTIIFNGWQAKEKGRLPGPSHFELAFGL